MRVNSHDRIAGYPAVAVRDFLRHAGHSEWYVGLAAQCMSIGPAEARAFVQALTCDGHVEAAPGRSGEEEEAWRVTAKGARLALATAARRLRRKTAEGKLKEFLSRVQMVNGDARYAYRVRKVVLFGSMLTDAEKVGDVDVAVELVPRTEEKAKWTELRRQCMERSIADDRRFSSIVDEVTWPEMEVMKVLKSRSRAISLHTFDDGVLERTEIRVIYELAE